MGGWLIARKEREGRIDDEGKVEGSRRFSRIVDGGWMNNAAGLVVVLVPVDAKGAISGENHHGPQHPRMNGKIAEEGQQ